MPADSHIAVPDAGTGEMPQPLFHAGSRFTFPEIVILNSDGRNGDLSDGAVGEQKILCQLCESGRRRSSCGAALQKTGDLDSPAAGRNSVNAAAGCRDAPKTGQHDFLHHPGLGGAELPVLQLGDLVVHHIFSTVIVAGAVDVLIGRGGIVFRGAIGFKGIIGSLCADRHRRKHGSQSQSQ